jgi:aspartate racemase
VHLGGWCAAATLTIEIARRLQEQGRTLGLVALFDAEVPGFVASVETRRSRMTALRATMKFHWDNLRRRGWKARFRYLFERVAQLFLRQLEWVYMTRRGMIAQLQRAMPFLPNVLFYNRWTQLSVEQLPQVRSIDAHIVLFRASEMMQLPGSDATLGWSAIARRGVDVVFVPGDHESMFKEPHLAQLGQKFSEALHQSEAELSSSTRR